MSELKSALRAVEKARSARADAIEAERRYHEKNRRAEAEGGPRVAAIDPRAHRLAKDVEDARHDLRQAEAALAVHAAPFIATLAADRAKLFRAALKAVADLEAAHKAETRLQAEHGWCKMPAIIGELHFSIHALRQRLEQTLRDLEPKPAGRVA